MRIRNLRYFVVLAEERNFHRAASRLHIEQSPLSRAIKTLEDDLGARLFERTQRGSCLTEAGQALLGEAQRVLAAYDLARRSVAEAVRDYQYRVRLGLSGMTAGLAHPKLARLLGNYRRTSPEVDLIVCEYDYGAMLRDLRDGLLDVGVTLGGIHADDLVIRRLWEDPIMAAVSHSHVLAARRVVSLDEVQTYPLVVCHPRSDAACSAQLRALVQQSDPAPVIGHYAISISGMLTLVAANFGVGFIARSQARMILRDDVRFLELADARAVFATSAIRRPGAAREPVARLLDQARLLRDATYE
ncbi:LysR family transcriptional regulator [Pusillimonas noertemannii]|uniref:DNA-binding transcriptional LysR family regulator n=1 Tax=Pusillimonas noertemannii TaxID=305977 RepID=A0A2U1CM97_9BURK|nr:LysR family transcriptional regulator [Pusillimonas noertemannii]NYT68868.1 LysR family transcriptional regulator [Pusillimonas noertemannii]PVY62111.1 DNA-binding transcriptional LysR family regulator [Pusillimonas noertemannii]